MGALDVVPLDAAYHFFLEYKTADRFVFHVQNRAYVPSVCPVRHSCQFFCGLCCGSSINDVVGKDA
jgi:hypothetical protein